MSRPLLLLPAVVLLIVTLLTEGKDIVVPVKFADSDTSVKLFVFDPVHIDLLDDAVNRFCSREVGDAVICPDLLKAWYMSAYTDRLPILLHDDATIVGRFTDDWVAEACGSEQHIKVVATDDPKINQESLESIGCVAATRAAIRSIKVHHTYQLISDAFTLIDRNKLIPLPAGWTGGVEGNIQMFHNKVWALQELADDRRVQTIAEIGFNMGHSTINWLVANPFARVLAFDISRQLYTAAAVNALDILLPGRGINLIEGDSSITVPNFAKLLRSQQQSDGDVSLKFNLLFIDGAHYYEIALADIVNMAQFANRTFHRVIIDDCGVSDVFKAVQTAVGKGVLIIHEQVATPATLCNIAETVYSGRYGGSYKFREKRADEPCDFWEQQRSASSDLLCIGEYSF